MMNTSFCFVVIIIILLIAFCTSKVNYQHVFDESALCEFYDPSLPKDFQNFYIANKLYEHNEEVNGKNVTLYFYPCRKKKIPNCDEQSAVCLLSNENKKESVINFGQSLKYSISDNQRRLESIGGEPCTSSENYTITIKFNCNEHSLHRKSKCNWILVMEDYTSCKQPYYTSTMDNHIINVRSLEKVKSLNITQNNKTYFLSFFKHSEECSTGISICEISNNGGDTIPLSDDVSQTVAYENNKLIITGHHHVKKLKTTAIIHIKCNWSIETVSNGKRIESASHKKYNFEVESSLGCIKLPLNCLIMDLDNNWMYNISSLNKPNGGWKVGNYNGTININVCGPLNLNNQEKSTCNEEFSQICLKETNNGINKYTNLGSIPLNFRVDGYTVKGTFVDGSVCTKNPNRTISTEIEFICDYHENGPQFVDYADECTYRLKWITPTACPILYRKSEDDCKFNDIDLSGLHNKTDDKILILSDSSRLRYNLCGSLTQPCHNDSSVSVCWIKDGSEVPVGYTSQTLVQINKSLSMNLEGIECGDHRYSTKINFVCSYSVSFQDKVLHNQIDNCKFEITIGTPFACRKTHKKIDCAVNSEIGHFNFSSLTKLDDDYYFDDPNDSNITYILNVCSPITNLLCEPDSAIYMVNYTNPHLHFKYQQIAYFGSTKLEFDNKIVKLNSTFGGACAFDKYRSTVNFMCLPPPDISKGPMLVRKEICSYEFQWQTKYACFTKTKKESPDEQVKTTVLPLINPNEISETERLTFAPSPSSIIINEKEKPETVNIVTAKMHTNSTIKPTQSKSIKPQNCSIENNKTNYILYLTALKTIEIKSKHNNYSVVFDKLLNSCKGFICKNEQLLMPLMDICPTIKFNYSSAMVKLSYTSQGCINGDVFKSDIWLKCLKPANDTPSILNTSNCRTEIILPTNAACLLLERPETATSTAGVAIGSSVGVVILVIFIIVGILFVKKRHTTYFTRICYQRIPEDKANVSVYCKDTTV